MSGRASTALSLAELFGLELVLRLVEVGEHAVKHGSDLLDLALALQLVEARGHGAKPGLPPCPLLYPARVRRALPNVVTLVQAGFE